MKDFLFSTTSGGRFRIKANSLEEAQTIYLKRIGVFHIATIKSDNNQEPERNVTPRPVHESRRLGFGNI